MDSDVSGAIRALSSEDSMAPVDMETWEALCERHPKAHMPYKSPLTGELSLGHLERRL
jgi:hypothetical protein